MKNHTIIGGGGLKLRVDETGNPNGQALLFIHGFAQSRLSWNKQLHSDLAKDFRLVALDLRGHGLSDKPKDVYGDSRLWADDINAVITTLGLHNPVLSGWSYGGLVICDYLRFYGEAQIGGVHLVGASSLMGEKLLPFIGKEFALLSQGIMSANVEESVAATERFLRLCVYEEPAPEDRYFFLGFNMLVPPYVRQGLFARNLNNDDLLPTLKKPVLITHGERDDIAVLDLAKYNAAKIAHARTSYYPNIGHAPFWEDAERFNRELREFAAGV